MKNHHKDTEDTESTEMILCVLGGDPMRTFSVASVSSVSLW